MTILLYLPTTMRDKLQNIIDRYEDLQKQSIDMEVISDQARSIAIHKELANTQEKYQLAKDYIQYDTELQEAKNILENESDEEMLELAKEQKKEAENTLSELEEKLKIALLPTDPNDDKNIYLEIRPAAGGDEAGLFATELLRMYLGYAQKK